MLYCKDACLYPPLGQTSRRRAPFARRRQSAQQAHIKGTGTVRQKHGKAVFKQHAARPLFRTAPGAAVSNASPFPRSASPVLAPCPGPRFAKIPGRKSFSAAVLPSSISSCFSLFVSSSFLSKFRAIASGYANFARIFGMLVGFSTNCEQKRNKNAQVMNSTFAIIAKTCPCYRQKRQSTCRTG